MNIPFVTLKNKVAIIVACSVLVACHSENKVDEPIPLLLSWINKLWLMKVLLIRIFKVHPEIVLNPAHEPPVWRAAYNVKFNLRCAFLGGCGNACMMKK